MMSSTTGRCERSRSSNMYEMSEYAMTIPLSYTFRRSPGATASSLFLRTSSSPSWSTTDMSLNDSFLKRMFSTTRSATSRVTGEAGWYSTVRLSRIRSCEIMNDLMSAVAVAATSCPSFNASASKTLWKRTMVTAETKISGTKDTPIRTMMNFARSVRFLMSHGVLPYAISRHHILREHDITGRLHILPPVFFLLPVQESCAVLLHDEPTLPRWLWLSRPKKSPPLRNRRRPQGASHALCRSRRSNSRGLPLASWRDPLPCVSARGSRNPSSPEGLDRA